MRASAPSGRLLDVLPKLTCKIACRGVVADGKDDALVSTVKDKVAVAVAEVGASGLGAPELSGGLPDDL